MVYKRTPSHEVFLHDYNDPAWNLCSYCLFQKQVTFDTLESAMNEVIRKNDALRMIVLPGGLTFNDYAPRHFERVSFADEDTFLSWAHDRANEPVVDYPGMWTAYLIHISGQVGVYNIGHHIMCDGLNVANLYQKIADELDGHGEGESYAGHLQEAEKYLSSRAHTRDKAYWDNVLSEPLPLAFSPRPIGFCDNIRLILPPIQEFCSKHALTEASVVYAATGLCLLRIQGLDALSLGIPILGRTTQREMGALGLFMHNVPMLLHGGDKSFVSFAHEVESDLFDLFRHQRYALPQRKLFDVSVDYSEYPETRNYDANVVYNDYVSTAMEFHFLQREQLELTIRAQRGTVRNLHALTEALKLLFKNIMKNPDQNIREIPIAVLSAPQEEIMIPPVGLYSMVEQQKGARIIEGDKAYHLADLLHDAEKVDIAVRGRKRMIGVLCDRSYQELAAIYGIIRGGNAYLPISPDYPQERISVLLEQSGCDTVLVQEKYRSLIQGGLSIEEILAAPAPKDIPPVAAEPDDPLYVIFTSGSTGIPKGAMVSNRAALNGVLWMCRRYFSPDTVVMLKTPFTFDFSVWEIFGFALGGFTLYILPPEDHYQQDKVLEHIRKGRVTDLYFSPTVFRYFLDVLEKDGGELPPLRNFFLSGEVLPANLVNAAPAPVHNLYGPTECAVDVTYYDCAAQETDPVPIGKPIDNCLIYVLDKYLQPLPVGATGQICIGGTPVGEGYVNDPVKTGAVFVPNPYAEGRLYLTGDLGYWREDGQLIFIGRNDQQVKINGQRIELGEIEAVLNTVTSEAAVIAENNHLIAFYTGEERLDLREQLGRKLPRHMVPHHFIHVDTMPLTASGKIDRKALPEVDLSALQSEVEYVAPETPEEITLTNAIQAVLSVERVGLLDNFFDLGGDSLKAIELIARLEKVGLRTNTKTIFTCETVKVLAAALVSAVPAEEEEVPTGDIPATAAQLRVYTAQNIRGGTAYNVPYVFKAKSVDPEMLERAVAQLIDRHEIFRTHFENRGGKIMQVTEASAPFVLERLESGDISAFVRPFDLSKAPLLRVGYFENTVMVDLHHIIADGGSVPVFLRELNELYMGRKLTDFPVQYRVFAAQKRDMATHEDYWLSVYREELPELALNPDFKREQKQSFRGAAVYDSLDGALHRKILVKCKALNVTPYAFYLGGFYILLSKFSGNEDIAVGTPSSGREGKFLNTLGMFVNTLAIRGRPEGDKSVRDFLREVKESSLAALEHQAYPYGELVKKLGLHTQGRNPLFDVMFAYQSEAMTTVTFGDQPAELLPVPVTTAKYDFTFNVLPRQRDVVLMVEYCTDLYKKQTIQRLLDGYKLILTQMLDEGKQLKDLSTMTETEKRALLLNFAYGGRVPPGNE